MLHTWGSALTHHPHVHGIVPGGGLSPDGKRWIACRPGFFLPVRVLSRLFRRRFLEELAATRIAPGSCSSSASTPALADAAAFAQWLAPLRQCEWVVYAKRPFAGPEAVLAYLSRYTHRVAISNSRLVALDERGVTFRWKDYRAKGRTRHKTMTLGAEEFMRRFLLHVLPGGFHRIRHYGLLANGSRKANLATARAAHAAPARLDKPATAAPPRPPGRASCAGTAAPDDHHRDLRTRSDHPRTASVIRAIMGSIPARSFDRRAFSQSRWPDFACSSRPTRSPRSYHHRSRRQPTSYSYISAPDRILYTAYRCRQPLRPFKSP